MQEEMPSEKRELLFDVQGTTFNIASAETRILELVSKALAGAFLFYFSLAKIYSELVEYKKFFKLDSLGGDVHSEF